MACPKWFHRCGALLAACPAASQRGDEIGARGRNEPVARAGLDQLGVHRRDAGVIKLQIRVALAKRRQSSAT